MINFIYNDGGKDVFYTTSVIVVDSEQDVFMDIGCIKVNMMKWCLIQVLNGHYQLIDSYYSDAQMIEMVNKLYKSNTELYWMWPHIDVDYIKSYALISDDLMIINMNYVGTDVITYKIHSGFVTHHLITDVISEIKSKNREDNLDKIL